MRFPRRRGILTAVILTTIRPGSPVPPTIDRDLGLAADQG
jgi:hypothetical protein